MICKFVKNIKKYTLIDATFQIEQAGEIIINLYREKVRFLWIINFGKKGTQEISRRTSLGKNFSSQRR